MELFRGAKVIWDVESNERSSEVRVAENLKCGDLFW